MLKLHPDCHNFTKFDSDRCPLVSVCDEDCVYVWKALYDGNKDSDKDIEIQDLKYEIEDLRSDIFHLEHQLDMADSKIEELTCALNGEE